MSLWLAAMPAPRQRHAPRTGLRTLHAVAAVVAKVAVAVADGDGAAVVATGGVELETGELLAPHRGARAVEP
jgi:hypothetical protein